MKERSLGEVEAVTDSSIGACAKKRKRAAGEQQCPPRRHVISLRISDEEMFALRTARGEQQSTSDFFREILSSYLEEVAKTWQASLPPRSAHPGQSGLDRR